MREILFRGKRLDNGEWAYGYLLADTADCSLKKAGKCVCPHDGSTAYILEWDDAYHEYREIEVDHSTIGQYTVQTDQSGQKIFEGDLVVWSDEEDGLGEVIWSEETSRFIICFPGVTVDFDNIYGWECEVWGNIHDHPELLEGGS